MMRKISKRKVLACLAGFLIGWAGMRWTFNYLESKFFGWHFVEVADITGAEGVTTLDPNWSGFEIIKCPNEPNKTIINWNSSINIPSGKCRVKHRGKSNLQVLAQIGDGGKYPAVIDTGNPGHAFVTHTVVMAEELAIYPFDCQHKNCGHRKKREGGLCYLNSLKIGELSFDHPFCTYRLCHYEKLAFGKAVKTEREINIGLELLKSFSYILIDNIKQEVEFSAEEHFSSDPNESWSKYPAVIERDETGNRRIMVEIDVGGKRRKVIFDTGSSSGLMVDESLWNQMRSELKVIGSKRGRTRMPHGFEPCNKVTLEQLSIGGRIVEQARIKVLGDDRPFGTDFFLMGMGFFRDKVIVIDLEHELFWVKD